MDVLWVTMMKKALDNPILLIAEGLVYYLWKDITSCRPCRPYQEHRP